MTASPFASSSTADLKSPILRAFLMGAKCWLSLRRKMTLVKKWGVFSLSLEEFSYLLRPVLPSGNGELKAVERQG